MVGEYLKQIIGHYLTHKYRGGLCGNITGIIRGLTAVKGVKGCGEEKVKGW